MSGFLFLKKFRTCPRLGFFPILLQLKEIILYLEAEGVPFVLSLSVFYALEPMKAKFGESYIDINTY